MQASAPALTRSDAEQPRHIVALGRLVGYKGYDVLVRAMQTIDGYATIIGEGPLLAELQQLAIRLGVSDRIRFAGRLTRSEIKQLFCSAQVFAFPSVTEAEAFGIVQIEAMAAGLPIVNTQLATTVPLVARHDTEALTVPPNDPHALSQALSSRSRRAGVGRKARHGRTGTGQKRIRSSCFSCTHGHHLRRGRTGA